MPGEIVIATTKAGITPPLVELLKDAVAGLAAGSPFRVAIAGGSAIPMLGDALRAAAASGIDLKQPQWQVWFVDERVVPLDHADSNYGAFIKGVFETAAWPTKHAHAIFPVKTDAGSPAAAAAHYEERLRAEFSLPHHDAAAAAAAAAVGTAAATGGTGAAAAAAAAAGGGGGGGGALPSFDLLLLGMGEDGHVASLFPGSPLLNPHAEGAASGSTSSSSSSSSSSSYPQLVAAVVDSPKPPAERVTLTLPVLNNARTVAYLVAGAGKVDALAAIFDPATPADKMLPAGRVQAASGGRTVWFMDAPAAAKLPAAAAAAATRV